MFLLENQSVARACMKRHLHLNRNGIKLARPHALRPLRIYSCGIHLKRPRFSKSLPRTVCLFSQLTISKTAPAQSLYDGNLSVKNTEGHGIHSDFGAAQADVGTTFFVRDAMLLPSGAGIQTVNEHHTSLPHLSYFSSVKEKIGISARGEENGGTEK